MKRARRSDDLTAHLSALQEAFDAAPFGVWARDRDGRVIMQNSECVRLWGRQIGKSEIESGAHPDVIASWQQTNRMVLAGRTVNHEEQYRVRRRARVFHNIVTPLRVGRRILGMLGFLIDITDSKLAEAALRQSEERYRLMVEAIPMMAWHCDAEGGLLEANSRWYAYTGQTRDEARGNGWMRALHPDDVHRVAQAVTDDVKGGVIYQTEYRLRRQSDGQHRWHLARALPVCDASGTVKAWFGAAADIHEQKCAEEQLELRVNERAAALRESEARLTRVLEGSHDGYWERDLSEDHVFLSRRCREILGLGDDDEFVNGATVWRQVHPDDAPRLMETAHACVKSGGGADHYDTEYRHCRPDGRIVWVHTRGTVTGRDAQGWATKVSGMITDITERKQVENDLQARSRQLAQLASELTMAEHRERRRLAERLHDNLQQQLVGARMQGQALLAGLGQDARPQMDALLQTLGSALDEARGVTQELAPRILLHKSVVDSLRWVARDMHKRHHLAVELQVEQDPDNVPEPAAVLLHTAARELLLNVVKHAGTRHASLRVHQDGDAVTLVVKDGGRGFVPEVIFAAADTSGFGLFSIRERAELLGGSLAVESAPGQGALAVLTLPLSPLSTRGRPR